MKDLDGNEFETSQGRNSDLHEEVLWVVQNLALVLVSRAASLQVP